MVLQFGDGERADDRRRWPLSAYLIVPAVVLALAAASNVFYQRSAAADDAERSAIADAKFAAGVAARALESDIADMQSQVASTAASPALGTVLTQPAGCTLNFSPASTFTSGHLDIVRADGTVVCSSLPLAGASDYGRERWFAAALRGQLLEAPVIDPRTDKLSLVIAAPIGAEGALVSVVDLETLGGSLSNTFGGPRRVEFVVMTNAGNKVIAGNADAFGTDRFHGRAELTDPAWALLAGARKSQALAAATRLSNRQIGITVAGFLLFAGAGWLVYRRIARPISELSSGVRAAGRDLTAQPIDIAAPVEVTQLVDDFNRLIAAARREREVTSLMLSIVESSPEAIIGISPQGDVTSWNGGAEKLFGFTTAEALGRQSRSLMPNHRVTEQQEMLARALNGERISQYETQLVHKDGRLLDVEASAAPVFDAGGQIIGVSGVLRDLTEWRRAEARRRDLEERVRRAERTSEQERELRLLEDRERIGRDLHDTVIQRLYATGLGVQGLANRMSEADIRERLIRVVDEIDAAIREIRAAIFAMDNGGMDDTREAVEDVLVWARDNLGVPAAVDFVGRVEDDIPPVVVDQMLVTLRECLSNIARHAAANHVAVTVSAEGEVALTVADDGVGVDEATAVERGGLGVASMRARAERLGGSFTIQRQPTGGTRVEWRVPAETRSAR